MPAHYPVPIQEDIRDLFFELLGRGVACDKVGPLRFEEGNRYAIGEYVTDDDELAGVCLVDERFVVRVGGALVMVAATVVEEMLRKNDVDPVFYDYIQEVLNILSRLLNSASTPHLRLRSLVRVPAEEVSPAIAALQASPEFRRDFAVMVEGYGEGRLSLLVN